MISLLSYRVIKSGEEIDIRPFEFEADFGEKALLEEEPPEEEIEEDADSEAIAQERAEFEKKIQEAMRQAEEVLETARIKAEEITRQAEEDARVAQEEGYQKGYDDGYQKGHDQGHQDAYREMTQRMEEDLEEQQNQMRQIIDSVTEEKERLLEQYLDDLKRICMAVSEKIIQTSLRSSGEVIKRMIVAATDKIKKTQWAKIYISRQDSEMLVRGDTQLLKEMAHLTDNLKVVAMENEDPGTCIIELPDEIVDASVNTQMENIKDILNNARL